MMIIEPNVELIEQGENIVSHVARCARVCYKKETGNDEVTYNNLLKNKHWSMFRHATSYYIISDYSINLSNPALDLGWIEQFNVAINKYKQVIVGIDVKYYNHNYYIVINGNWALDHQNLVSTISDYKVEDEVFANFCFMAWNMMRYTFKITTQISTSRELNRVSPNNIAEQSTRYIYEDGTLCRPYWLEGYKISKGLKGGLYVYKDENTEIEMNNKVRLYIGDCERSFNTYKELVNCGLPRQDARGVLPLDTATEVVYTYSIPTWKHIIELRADKRAHPNAQIIANMINNKLQELGY